jgi:hypothetical protein
VQNQQGGKEKEQSTEDMTHLISADKRTWLKDINEVKKKPWALRL